MKKVRSNSGSVSLAQMDAQLARVLEFQDKDKCIEAFYAAVIEDARRPQLADRSPDYRGSGISSLEVSLQFFFPPNQMAHAKAAAHSAGKDSIPAVRAMAVQWHDQRCLFFDKLPQYAWDTAAQMVERDLDAALRWIESESAEHSIQHAWLEAYYRYVQGLRRAHARPPMRSKRGETAEFWVAPVAACGGGRHLLTLALSAAITCAVAQTCEMFEGREYRDGSSFRNPHFREFLRTPSDIWLPAHQAKAIALGYMPEALVDDYVEACEAPVRAVFSVYKAMYDEVDRKRAKATIAETELAALRKRSNKAEDALAEVRAKLQKATDEIAASKRSRLVAVGDSDAQRECTELRVALRESESQLAKVQASADDRGNEVTRLREFLGLMLEPCPDVEATGFALPAATSDPATWRIVFVGGHERFHHKLRKVLKGAVFLHPDQSQVQTEVFDNADAVIFSIGYCSHALAWRAADIVRKRGLRAGYANHSNVELVLDEIRIVLFGGQPVAAEELRAA